jgi:hypothetical protein
MPNTFLKDACSLQCCLVQEVWKKNPLKMNVLLSKTQIQQSEQLRNSSTSVFWFSIAQHNIFWAESVLLFASHLVQRGGSSTTTTHSSRCWPVQTIKSSHEIISHPSINSQWCQTCMKRVTRYLQSNEDFKCVICCPLCTCESTDHNNTKRKAACEKAPHSKSSYSLDV